MEFGVVLQTDPPASRVIELTERAEQNGFTYGWTFDSHVLWQEPFVIYSRMLAATENMIVGPMVTNPGTRDWTVIASLFATLNEMSGGRTICGMGRGDSALRYIGLKPKTLATMEASMDAIKALVRGDEIELNDKTLSIPWVENGYDLPMWGAGYGPKALTLIGQKCDGSFNANKSKTFAVPVSRLYRAFSVKRTRERWLPKIDLKIRTSTADKSMRITWPDDTSVHAYFTAKGANKSQIAIQHVGLPGKKDIAARKEFWAERLTARGDIL